MQKRTGLILLFVCIAAILAAGCTGSATAPAAAVTTPAHNEISGTWTATFGGGICIMTITPDGTVQQHMGGTSDVRNARWTDEGSGKYSLSADMMVSGQSPLTYDEITDTIIDGVGIVWRRTGNEYITIVPTVPTKDPRSAHVKLWNDGEGYIVADVTNVGSSSQAFYLVIDYYDGNVKLDTRTPVTPVLAPGETGRIKSYPPSDTTKYRLNSVAVSIGGKFYKVHYDAEVD